MSDMVTIWNLALSAVGGRALISSPVEKSREADLCRLHYPIVRDTMLKAASWPCANAWERLALLRERSEGAWLPDDPPPNWRFAYSLPNNLLAPRYLMSFRKFNLGQYGAQIALLADEEQPILHYTAKVENVALFDRSLFNAIVSALSARLCIPLTAKDNRAAKLRDEAVEAVLLARTEFANESDEMFDSLPSWIQARGLSMQPHLSRYVWPGEDFSPGFLS